MGMFVAAVLIVFAILFLEFPGHARFKSNF